MRLLNAFAFISTVVIRDHSSPDGVSRIIGPVANRKAVGTNIVDGVSSNGEEGVGKDTARGHIARRDIISSRVTAMAIGTIGTSSITTISIGASNNRVDRPLQLAAKL